MFVYAIILVALIAVYKGIAKEAWFSLALVFMGLYLLNKALLMNSDSSLWLSVMFISAAFAILLSFNIKILNGQLLLLLSIGVALSSLVVFLVWQNEAHLYMFITNFLAVVPAVLYTYKFISFLIFVLAVIGVNIFNFIVYKLFIYLFANKIEEG